jgi:hypothetical protein
VDIRPHRARVKSPQRRWRLNSFTSSPPARAPMRCVGLSTVALKTAALAAHAALRQAMIFVGLYTLDFGRRGLLPHERPGRTTFAPNPKRLASSKRSSIVCAQRLSRLKLRRISRQPAPLSNRPRRSTKTTGVNGRLLSRAGICYRLADGRSEGGNFRETSIAGRRIKIVASSATLRGIISALPRILHMPSSAPPNPPLHFLRGPAPGRRPGRGCGTVPGRPGTVDPTNPTLRSLVVFA